MNCASVIITYKNSEEDLEKIKKNLLESGVKRRDIYFSNNLNENLGYGGGINRILKKEKKNYSYFFIANPDIIIKKNCIKILIKILENNPTIGVVGPKIIAESGKIWSMGGELDKKRYTGGLIDYGKTNKRYINTNIAVDFISGTAMLIRKEVFEKIGLFAQDYFLYYEDVDFCIRAKKAGFQLAINQNAEITHYASTSTGKNSPLMQYYMARNHLLFVERHAPFSIKLYEWFRLPKTLYQARHKKYELLGIRDYFLRKFGESDYF